LLSDEVAALVVDIGSSSLRAGHAGDDTPKAIIPTSYGYHRENPGNDVMMADTGDDPETITSQYSKNVRLYLGQHGPSVWRENMEVRNPMREGLSAFDIYLSLFFAYSAAVYDFNPIAPLIRNALVDVMRCTPSEHPILVTEPPWNTVANRERMAEIMFEDFQVPAFYIANTGVLNAYVNPAITPARSAYSLSKVRCWEGFCLGHRCWTIHGECNARG
jgi:actin-like protein 6B